MEVTCSYSDAVNEGSSEVTCTTGTIFTFSTEPTCPLPGLKHIIEYEIFGEGSQISANQKRESTVFSLLIG